MNQQDIVITVASRAGVGKTTVVHGLAEALRCFGYEVVVDPAEVADAVKMGDMQQKFIDLGASGKVKIEITSQQLRRDGTMPARTSVENSPEFWADGQLG